MNEQENSLSACFHHVASPVFEARLTANTELSVSQERTIGLLSSQFFSVFSIISHITFL